MKHKWLKESMIIGTIMVLIGASVVSALNKNITIDAKHLKQRNTLYVGGSGPGNYTKIQDAVDDANTGDTVFVYDRLSPYMESLSIRKSIQLIGENKTTTIINSPHQMTIYSFDYDNIVIQGFTLLNYCSSTDETYGIDLSFADNFTLTDTIIIGCHWGIHLAYCSNCTITNNEIRDGIYGISFYHVGASTLSGNHLTNNEFGVELNNARTNKISYNIFTNNGMYLVDYAYPNSIIENTVNGKALLYLENKSDMVIEDDSAGQIILAGCNRITMQNLILSNATVGVEFINTDNCLLTNTIIRFNMIGVIFLESCNMNTISYNYIDFNSNGIGVESEFSFIRNKIIGNSMRFNSYCGICLNGIGNIVKYNVVENNSEGIVIVCGIFNLISKNVIRNNTQIGLEIYYSGFNLVKSNNIMQNKENAVFEMMLGTVFFRNYWTPYIGFGPKVIRGSQWIFVGFNPRHGYPILVPIPWVKFDWLPTRHPYDIPGMN
jgi:parallel beta-helix repeat protein